MPRPNWFLAFPLDGRFVTNLPAVPPNFSLYHPDDVHLTLAFLGPCGEASAQRALLTLDELLIDAKQEPLEISLGEVVPMGSRRAYSALSALVEHGRQRVEECLGALSDPLTFEATGRHLKRPPKPHVTLARPRRRASRVQREAGLTWAQSLDLHDVSSLLDRIALYTWSEDRRERRFRIVADRILRIDAASSV